MRQSIHDLKSSNLIKRLLPMTVALLTQTLWAQGSQSVHSFSISDIGNPQSWRSGRVTVGEGDDIVITALDEAGSKVTDFNGVVYLKQETDYGPGRIEPDSVRLENGEWAGTIRVFRRGFRRAKNGEIGDVWVEVSDLAPEPHVGISNLFAAFPEPFSRLLIVLPGEEHAEGSVSGKTGEAIVPKRGTDFTIQVISTDKYWNRLHSIDDVIRVTSSNPTAVIQDDSPINNGRVSMQVSFDDAGSQGLTAIDLDDQINIASYSQVVEIGPSDPDALAIAANVENITALQASEITATVTDDAGNRVPNTEVQFVVLSGTGTVSPNSAISDSLGIARTTFTAGQVNETNLIRANLGSLSADVEIDVAVGMNIAASAENITALQTTEVAVTLGDDAGNRVPNTEVQFAVISGTGTVNPSSAVSNSLGIAKTTFTAGQANETNVVRATFGSLSADVEIMVNVGVNIAATEKHILALQATEVEVILGDETGNRVPNSEVRFAVISGTGTISPTSAISDSLGKARTVFTAGQLTETNLVRATFGSVSSDVEIMVTVTPDLPNDTIVNYPNPFGLTQGSTSFDYHLSEDADVTLRIYDLFGNLVWSRDFDAGAPGGLGRSGTTQPNSIEWDGRNDDGQMVGSGGYILVAKAVANRKVIMETKRKIALIR
ncbi:Ig-like domain-containing protein [bacterium]|nr:Ig-like domain-containing protein [bacterium]